MLLASRHHHGGASENLVGGVALVHHDGLHLIFSQISFHQFCLPRRFRFIYFNPVAQMLRFFCLEKANKAAM